MTLDELIQAISAKAQQETAVVWNRDIILRVGGDGAVHESSRIYIELEDNAIVLTSEAP